MTHNPSLLFPEAAEGSRLHENLVRQFADAPSELAAVYFPPLLAWLRERHRNADPHLCDEAAADAILQLIKRPDSFDPAKADLATYLRMSAGGDLLNLLAKQGRRRRKQRDLKCVEDGPDGGNYYGRDGTPLDRLCEAEEEARGEAVLARVRGQLPEAERPVLDLIAAGERSTGAFAEALGVAHLPPEERERAVKKAKDRIKVRIKREGRKR